MCLDILICNKSKGNTTTLGRKKVIWEFVFVEQQKTYSVVRV
jgi:hypothetical protein